MSFSYAIIGTGAIGGYYGARLQQSGCDVHFLLRSDYAHVRDRGITVASIDGDFSLPQVNAYRNAKDIPPVDVAIVALKTTQNALLTTLLPPIKENGAILSLQNGLGVEADIVQQLKAQQLNAQQLNAQQPNAQQLNVQIDTVPAVLGGLCFICSNKVDAGHIRHMDYGKVVIGAHHESNQPSLPTPCVNQIVEDFTRANIEIAVTEDLPMARWQKLVWNVPYNGLSVVLDATTEAMMASGEVRTDQSAPMLSLITTLMEEVVTVANAWGEQISPGTQRGIPKRVIAEMLEQTEAMPPYRTSMKIDYDEKRPLEIEAILGEPIRTAQQLGIPVPAMTMLYQQLMFLNDRNQA
ncbi:MAG: 2-dehydropantoate 2-reductase [Cyanobacteria bacterium J06598_3]